MNDPNVNDLNVNGSLFQTGGPVASDAPCYVSRKADALATRLFFTDNRCIALYGPRQVGKTSLLSKLEEIAAGYDHATAHVDLSTMNDPQIEPAEWCLELHERLVQELAPRLEAPAPAPPHRLVSLDPYWRAWVEALGKRRLRLFFDEAASVPARIRDTFYSTIRKIISAPELRARINFVFAGVFDPSRLIKERENSPFNVSRNLLLGDWSLQEAHSLFALLYERHGVEGDLDLETRIHELTAGQPYLTQCALEALDEEARDTGRLPAPRYFSLLREEIARRGAANIRYVVGKTVGELALRQLARRILEGERIRYTDSIPEIAELALLGTIRNHEEHCRIRNPLYAADLENALSVTGPATLPEPPKPQEASSQPLPEAVSTAGGQNFNINVNVTGYDASTHGLGAEDLARALLVLDEIRRAVDTVPVPESARRRADHTLDAAVIELESPESGDKPDPEKVRGHIEQANHILKDAGATAENAATFIEKVQKIAPYIGRAVGWAAGFFL